MSGDGMGGDGMSGPDDGLPVDLSRIVADDELLDALGRGEPGPADDEFAGTLAAWRAELEPDGPARPDDGVTPSTVESAGKSTVEPRPGRLERPGPRRWMRRAAAGVAAAAVLTVGLGIGADHAGPTSPLWPLTRAAFPDNVDPRLAEHRIALAREAVAQGRYDDARRLLDQAQANADRVRDPRLAQRLRDAIEEVRRTLPVDVPVPVPPVPSASAVPVPPTGGQSGNPQQPGVPGVPPVPPVPVPPIPVPPVPTVPVPPVPTLPLPPVPTLPLPTPPIGG